MCGTESGPFGPLCHTEVPNVVPVLGKHNQWHATSHESKRKAPIVLIVDWKGLGCGRASVCERVQLGQLFERQHGARQVTIPIGSPNALSNTFKVGEALIDA